MNDTPKPTRTLLTPVTGWILILFLIGAIVIGVFGGISVPSIHVTRTPVGPTEPAFGMLFLGSPYEEIAAAIHASPSAVNEFDSGGNALIVYAVKNRRPDVVRLLLDLGADPNGHVSGEGCSIGFTPLYTAINRRDLESIRMLLEAGADPHRLGYMCSTPMSSALSSENPEIVKIFQEWQKLHPDKQAPDESSLPSPEERFRRAFGPEND